MLIEAIKKRRSIRAYRSDAVADELIDEIVRAGQLAPTAHGTGAVEFIVVKDQKVKDALFAVTGQDYVKEVPVIIVPVATEAAMLPVQDLSVACENIFLQATELELGSVWKNVSPEWEEKVKKILGVPDKARVINLIPLGFSDETPETRVKEAPVAEKIHQDKW